MKELTLREIIRNRRAELNISQEELCEGLCDRTIFSRFENGHLDLSYKRVSALLERLGLPHERYYALLTDGEQALEAAEREARCVAVRLERAAEPERPALWAWFREKLAALEALGPDDPFIRQCSLSLRAVLGTEAGPYGFEERLGMQLEAIRLTAPRFDLERIGLGPYSAEELRLINQIAETNVLSEQYEKAVRIHRMALEYLEVNGQKLSLYSYFKASYSASCSNALSRMSRYEEALDMAEAGVLASLESKRYHTLATLLWVKAYCFYCMGNREESVRLYRQVHYILVGTRETEQLRYLDDGIKELLGVEFPD